MCCRELYSGVPASWFSPLLRRLAVAPLVKTTKGSLWKRRRNMSGATFLSACLRNLVTVVRFRILHNLPTRNRAAKTRLRASLARFFALTRSPLTAREAEDVLVLRERTAELHH